MALGQLGYVVKGLAFVVIGLLLTLAAVTRDPGKTGGLDESLYELLEEGRTIDIANVDAVLRMVQSEDSQLSLPTLEKKGKVRMAQIATRSTHTQCLFYLYLRSI